jgi:hypothetical protein
MQLTSGAPVQRPELVGDRWRLRSLDYGGEVLRFLGGLLSACLLVRVVLGKYRKKAGSGDLQRGEDRADDCQIALLGDTDLEPEGGEILLDGDEL